jgi:hypothetical protein
MLLATFLLLVASTALAQSGSGPSTSLATSYELSWWTVDGGGAHISAGEYTLAGTVGQPDANALTGGGYTLAGGFWGGGALTTGYEVFLPLVLRSH